MAQLRHDYQKFSDLNTQVLVMVPNGPKMIEKYVVTNAVPYPILTDKNGLVASRYGVNIRNTILPGMRQLFKPSVFLVDRSGIIRYSNYLKSYIQEPDNREPLAVLMGMAD